jgi:hypothetical protein
VQLAAVEPEAAPGEVAPAGGVEVVLGVEHGAQAGARAREQLLRVAVLDDAAALDDQHPGEAQRGGDVVGDAQQGGAVPGLAGAGQQVLAGAAVEAAQGLVEDHQPGRGPQQRAGQSHALALAAGDQRAALTEAGL